MKQFIYLPYFILALLLHLALLILLKCPNNYSTQKMGLKDKVLLHAYIYQPQKTSTAYHKQQRKIIAAKNKNINKAKSKQKITHVAKLNPLTQKINLSKGNYNKLLELLHNAIANTKQYPQSAAMLGQKGKVVLRFKLNPNGKISQLEIVKSSGYPLLDHAAQAAIDAINPFTKAKYYLKSKKSFTIAIVFST